MRRWCRMLLRSKVLSVVILFALTGCAFDLAHVSYRFASLSLSQDQQKSIVLQNLTEVPTPCFHTRILQGGTHWDFIGTIPEGEVYKPRDQVLTMECSNIFEAYLVLSGHALVGFYLPVQEGFVPVKETIELPIHEGELPIHEGELPIHEGGGSQP